MLLIQIHVLKQVTSLMLNSYLFMYFGFLKIVFVCACFCVYVWAHDAYGGQRMTLESQFFLSTCGVWEATEVMRLGGQECPPAEPSPWPLTFFVQRL